MAHILCFFASGGQSLFSEFPFIERSGRGGRICDGAVKDDKGSQLWLAQIGKSVHLRQFLSFEVPKRSG